ncbi:MAG: D-alanyl-D-alanine carboxypeptidase family protein [Candidatus Aenigmatarchaeota archaeon]
MYGWLKKNANKYGFFEVYDSNPKRTGFAYEPWHWSFAGLSIPILRDFLHIDINEIRDSAIYGSEYFTDDFLFEYKQKWILGINRALMP